MPKFISILQSYETNQNSIYKQVFTFISPACYNKSKSLRPRSGKEGIQIATLDDIARELAVSKSTVSKALSGAKDVSKTMRQMVLEKAVEMGYSRTSRNTAAPRLAVFITNMEYINPEDFGYEFVVGFRKAAEPAGYQVDLIPLDQQMQESMRYDEYMVLGSYSGGLFLGLSLSDLWMKDFETCRTPTVLYDNHVSGNPNVTHVGVDNEEGMGLAVQHLKNLGHQKIGYLSSELKAYVYKHRYLAFFQAMKKYGLDADPDLTGAAYHASDCLSQHLPRLLEKGCTAIICSHDMLANSVLVHCTELGLHVPEDISILGFDDIPLCRYTTPPLSTIRQDRTGLGKSAFFALSSHLNKAHLSTFFLHAELIQRSSCAAAPSKKSSL